MRSIGHGGTGGNPFDDLDPFNLSGLGNQKITSITVGHGDYVDYIGVGGSGDNWPSSGSGHGGYEGQMDTFSLDDDEWLTEIHGRSGSYLDQVVFYLNSGHVSPVYGGYGGVPFIEKMDKGIIKAFFGRSGSYVDQLGVYFAKLGPTPVLVTPVNGQTFKRFHTARKTTLIWRPVADPAAGYYVEVQYLLQPGDWKPLTSQSIQGTSLTFDFPGAYPGRWRVSAAGHFSEWWSFTYAV